MLRLDFLHVVAAFLVFFVLLVTLFPELNLTPLFFTSGVVSIVVGLAVQDVMSNLLAGLVLSLDRPFEVGDWVHVGDNEGEVVKITWRTTKIRGFEGDYTEIPNSIISKERIVNHHAPSSLHLRRIYVGVTYDTPPGLTVKALLEAASEVNGVREKPAPEAHFVDYQDCRLLFELRVWIDHYQYYPIIQSDIRKRIWYAFKRYNITIPFPIRDVNLKQIEETPTRLKARLISNTKLRGRPLFEMNNDRLSIGRSPENDILIADPSISKKHAVIERRNDRFVIRDLNSRHGTFLNGKPVNIQTIFRGDEISLGAVTLTFETNTVPLLQNVDNNPIDTSDADA